MATHMPKPCACHKGPSQGVSSAAKSWALKQIWKGNFLRLIGQQWCLFLFICPEGPFFPICIKVLVGALGTVFSTLHTHTHLTLKQARELDNIIPIFTNEETDTEELLHLPKLILPGKRGASCELGSLLEENHEVWFKYAERVS